MAHRKLGKYEIAERLGRGGMAEVYRAYHANLDRFVAIKVLHAFLADDPEFKTRFEKEARNIARLRHNNIVQVYDFDFDEESESYYMVMELVEGPTLKELLFRLSEQGKLLSLASVVQIIKEAARALAYAHSQSMVHRDVKPGNLMLDRDERVILTDFGIAKIVTGAQFTSTGGMVGTPAYMAPEQGLGEPGDERADLYSLGVIFFQMVTGRLPFDAETPLAVILKHLNEPVPSARTYRPDLPELVDAVIMRLLSKDPTTRYQNANELIGELDLLEHEIDLTSPSVNTLPNEVLLMRSDRLTPTPLRMSTPTTGTLPIPAATPSTTTPPMPSVSRRGGAGWTWLLAGIIVLAVGVGLYALAANQGLVPAIGVLPSSTPTNATTATAEPTMTVVSALVTGEPSPTSTVTATAEPSSLLIETATASATPTEAASATSLPTATASRPPSLTPTSTPTSSSTPTATDTASHTPTRSATTTPTASRTPTHLPSATPTASPSATSRHTRTPTATRTASVTPRPVPTATPQSMPLLAVTQTLVQATRIVENRQATLRACEFDYRIVDQVPANGELFPTNSAYVREITLRNTGTCEWERNTSLNFVSGESFSAGPRIFIREPVPVGQTYVLRFEGRTPQRNGTLTGQWELRTPELIQIGQPIEITLFAYAR